MPASRRRRLTIAVRAAALAGVAAGVVAVVPGLAQAAPAPVLRSDLAKPAAVAPGGRGTLHYELTNLSGSPTDGILLTVVLPKHVGIPTDTHCRETGKGPHGGTVVSCRFTDELGRLGPGQVRKADTPFAVAKDAPHGKELGRLGTIAVPMRHGKPTEDWRHLSGRNVSWTTVRTR
ncbi:MAG TPA: hypothetical protein VGH99_19450 [Pseudonocardia sp.]